MHATIYTKNHCIHCEAAKRLMRMKGMVFNEKSIDKDREGFIKKFPHVRMAPHILIDGKEIGGFDKLKEYFNENRL